MRGMQGLHQSSVSLKFLKRSWFQKLGIQLHALLHYSAKYKNIIPKVLILFRKGGILPVEGCDCYVYDRKAGSRKMEAV